MLSYFIRASQRVSQGGLLQIGRVCKCNHVRTTGSVADWDAHKYSKEAKFVFENSATVLGLLDPQPGERILDFGCGSGELTMVLKDAGSSVVAVDASPAMVEVAKAKGLDARVCDGHDLAFTEEFDAVFSNNALHFMFKDPRQMATNIYNALKKNGRLVAELAGTGGWDSFLKHAIPILKRHGALDTIPLYLPSKEEYAELLESQGFEINHLSLLHRER